MRVCVHMMRVTPSMHFRPDSLSRSFERKFNIPELPRHQSFLTRWPVRLLINPTDGAQVAQINAAWIHFRSTVRYHSNFTLGSKIHRNCPETAIHPLHANISDSPQCRLWQFCFFLVSFPGIELHG